MRGLTATAGDQADPVDVAGESFGGEKGLGWGCSASPKYFNIDLCDRAVRPAFWHSIQICQVRRHVSCSRPTFGYILAIDGKAIVP